MHHCHSCADTCNVGHGGRHTGIQCAPSSPSTGLASNAERCVRCVGSCVPTWVCQICAPFWASPAARPRAQREKRCCSCLVHVF
eukprot:gene11898-biopygen22927